MVRDFEDYTTRVNELGLDGWVFRGHSRVRWRIESSLARYLRTHQLNIREDWHDVRELNSIHNFQKAAHQFISHLPPVEDLLSWLAVMQHFGAPTRLIDFTYSPHVALFFAATGSVAPVKFGEDLLEDELDERYGPYEIHALSFKQISTFTKQMLRTNGPPRQHRYKIGASNEQDEDFIGFFEGRWHNPRQVAQQGLFIIPSKIDMDIHAFIESCKLKKPGSPSNWVIFRFEGGRKAYKQMARNLVGANLSEASLFPGIEGIARSLHLKWYEPTAAFALTEPVN